MSYLGEDTAQDVKYLPYNYENLNCIPMTHIQNQAECLAFVTLVLVEDTGNSEGFMDSLLPVLCELIERHCLC